MASHVLTALGADEPSRILLIHGHAVDRLLLKDWLQNEQLAHPIVMAQEFTAGQTLPEKFEFLATQADAAIALATPDDLGQAALQPANRDRGPARTFGSRSVGSGGASGDRGFSCWCAATSRYQADLDGIGVPQAHKALPGSVEQLASFSDV